MREARIDAAFNNLHIARAACEPLKINGLRSQVAHDSNFFARCKAEIFVYNHYVQESAEAAGARRRSGTPGARWMMAAILQARAPRPRRRA